MSGITTTPWQQEVLAAIGRAEKAGCAKHERTSISNYKNKDHLLQ
jgi:hypothetical protein